MMEYIQKLERERLLQVAQEYIDKGFRVALEPRGTDLPGFLSRFSPDLIVYDGEQAIVVEVKSHATLAESEDLQALARAIESQPGWQLVLDVTNPDIQAVDVGNAEELNQAEMHDRLAKARYLSDVDQDDAALVLVWSALEAALRLLAKRQNIELETNTPAFVLKQLYSLGALSREEYDLLQKSMRQRNLVAHGFRAPEVPDGMLEQLMHKVEEFTSITVPN